MQIEKMWKFVSISKRVCISNKVKLIWVKQDVECSGIKVEYLHRHIMWYAFLNFRQAHIKKSSIDHEM